ncbi:MAG TPA: hypothetical protein V6D29_22225, partial [Leptolyngbyaceae cyanobacterium]
MSGGKPIPIQLVDDGGTSDPGSGTPLAEEPVAPNQLETAVIDPTQAAFNSEPVGDPTVTTEEIPLPSDAGDLPATVPAQPGEDAIAPSPSLVPNAPPETSAASPEESGRPATAGPLPGGNVSSGNGQLVPLGIQADPAGRDLPDTLPQLQSGESLVIQPYLAGCDVGNLGALSSSPPAATVQMRITVEASGQVSQATVVRGSGDPTVDALATCLVERGLHLAPATTAGVERPTDAVLLEARLQW